MKRRASGRAVGVVVIEGSAMAASEADSKKSASDAESDSDSGESSSSSESGTTMPPASKSARTRGRVVVDKLPGRYSGKKWPVRDGYYRVNCTSGAPGVWKQLSPMKLGPITVSRHGWNHKEDSGEQIYNVKMPLQATNLENTWQASKVWNGESELRVESSTDLNTKYSTPSKEFFTRRAAVWADEKAHRWIKKGTDASGNKNIPLYSLWGAQKLSYIEARKKIYCPIYAALVKHTDAYKRLEKMLDDGENVLLLEYDGYDRGDKSLKECLEDPSRPFGHGLVLECLLTGVEPWKDSLVVAASASASAATSTSSAKTSDDGDSLSNKAKHLLAAPQWTAEDVRLFLSDEHKPLAERVVQERSAGAAKSPFSWGYANGKFTAYYWDQDDEDSDRAIFFGKGNTFEAFKDPRHWDDLKVYLADIVYDFSLASDRSDA